MTQDEQAERDPDTEIDELHAINIAMLVRIDTIEDVCMKLLRTHTDHILKLENRVKKLEEIK